ncbi:MAG: helix-turn-helix domain-containing protein [Actinomycetaceae bacterium]
MMSPRNPSTGASSDDAPEYLAPAIGSGAMKAFAHPLRMAMYDYLSDQGAATATMLARHTGESTGQTSYHLRQLERHGLIAEDHGRGTGRERWWTAVGFRMDGVELAREAGTRPAVETVLNNQVEQRARALRDWYARSEAETPDWQAASVNSRHTTALTVDEMRELRDEVMTLIHDRVEAAKARREQDGAGRNGGGPSAADSAEIDDSGAAPEDRARRVRIYLDIFPLAQED